MARPPYHIPFHHRNLQRPSDLLDNNMPITGPYRSDGRPNIQFYYLSDDSFNIYSFKVQIELANMLNTLIDSTTEIDELAKSFIIKNLISTRILVYDEKFECNKNFFSHRDEILKNYKLEFSKIEEAHVRSESKILLMSSLNQFINCLKNKNFNEFYLVIHTNTLIHNGFLKRIDASQQTVDIADFV